MEQRKRINIAELIIKSWQQQMENTNPSATASL